MRTLSFGLFALAVAGCGSGKDSACDPATDPNQCLGTNPTGGTNGTDSSAYVGPSCDDARSFSFGLDYAWDDAAAQTVSFSIDGYSSPSVFYIEYGDASWNGDPNLSLCIKMWDIDGSTKSQTALDAFAANGFDVNPAAGAPIIDTCADGIATGDICPDFFNSSNGQAVESLVYQWLAMAEDPAPDIASQLASYFDPGTYWRSTLNGDLFPSESEGYSFGFGVDASFNVTSTTADIQQSTMQTANGQTNGYYRMLNPYIWSFQ